MSVSIRLWDFQHDRLIKLVLEAALKAEGDDKLELEGIMRAVMEPRDVKLDETDPKMPMGPNGNSCIDKE